MIESDWGSNWPDAEVVRLADHERELAALRAALTEACNFIDEVEELHRYHDEIDGCRACKLGTRLRRISDNQTPQQA